MILSTIWSLTLLLMLTLFCLIVFAVIIGSNLPDKVQEALTDKITNLINGQGKWNK